MSDFNSLQKWFTGKALANLQALLPALAQSEEQGYWVPGISRKVHAAITKVSGATQKLGKQADAWYNSACNTATYGTVAYQAGRAWHSVGFAFYFASSLDDVLPAVKLIEEFGESTAEQKVVLGKAREFVADLQPIRALVKKLDATRPVPVFTKLGLSPTVTATLTEQLKLNVATIRFPEFETTWIETEGKRIPVLKIIWPKGTIHGASRFAHGNQCHACAHAIRNPYNWVPFVMDDAAGVPHSFWVGRDCAKNIFNVDVKGDAEYATGSQAPGENIHGMKVRS